MGVGEDNLLWINILRDYSHYWKGLKRTSSMEGRIREEIRVVWEGQERMFCWQRRLAHGREKLMEEHQGCG